MIKSLSIVNFQSGYLKRWAIRPKASYKEGPWGLRFVGYYQPSLDHWQDDYILKSTASVAYWLNKTIGLKVEREDEYRSVSLVDENHSARTSAALTTKLVTVSELHRLAEDPPCCVSKEGLCAKKRGHVFMRFCFYRNEGLCG